LNIDNEENDDFWDRVNALIDLAKQQAKESDEGNTSASFLYAAARFNAFTSASTTKNKDELVNKRKLFSGHMIEQYRTAFEESLDDYISNYEKYSAKDRS